MPNYRDQLPQLTDQIFLTDGGLETYLVFHEGMDLPHFAAFTVLGDPAKTETLKAYYRRFLDIAANAGTGFILDTVTWRANRDWGRALGLSGVSLKQTNKHAAVLIASLRSEYADKIPAIVLNGVIGPRGDGYVPGEIMNAVDAAAYHSMQIETFAATEIDMVSAVTMTNAPEAVGIARAAKVNAMPCVISFTTETNGCLPSGQTLEEAIQRVDGETGRYPAYYMINCAHPSHFADVLSTKGNWLERIRGLRTNASKLSHAELDASETLDEGNPAELGTENSDLRALCPSLTIFGGCCGTDHRHVLEISNRVQVEV